MSATLVQPVPTTTLMTADEFAAKYENIFADLVKGVVKEYPMPGAFHGKACSTIGRKIGNHVEAHDLGHVMSNDTWIRTHTNPDSVRGADVIFISYSRLPKEAVPAGMLTIPPELVVEVKSPSDRWNEIYAKVAEYLNFGINVVIVLDPASQSATIYRHDELHQTIHNSDVLTIPDVLPGFSVVISDLFK